MIYYVRRLIAVNRKYKMHIIIVLLTFIMMILLNHYTPMHADDYDYSFSFATKERIRSIEDVIQSQIAHYQIQNGRMSTLGLAQVLLMCNQNIIDIILSSFYVLLGILIAYHIEGSIRKINWLKLLYIYIMVFLFTPAIGQSYLWTNSAAIYLGGVNMILVYLIPYRRVLYAYTEGWNHSNGVIYNTFMFFLMLILGFIAGDTGESMSAGLMFMVLGYLVCFGIYRIKIYPWMYGIGNIMGLVALFVSPGNRNRIASAGGISIINIPKRLVLVTGLFIDKMMYFVVLLSLVISISYLLFTKKQVGFVRFLKSFPAHGYIYFVGTLASVFSMILLSFFPIKAWSISVVLSVITLFVFGSFLEKNIEFQKYKIPIMVTTIAIVISFCGIYMNAFFTVKSVNHENDKRLAIIENAIDKGDDTVMIPAIVEYNKYTPYEGSGELSWDSSEWPNKSIAKYYGLKAVIREDNPLRY